MPEYKVVEVNQKKGFGRHMTAKDLEKILNKEAVDGGWTLDRIMDAEAVGYILGSRDIFLVIFRK